MKKIIAIVLVAVFMLTLVACAPSFKEPDERVEAKEFYEKLREALGVDKDYVFEKDIEAKGSANAKVAVVSDYDDGNTAKEWTINNSKTTTKYNKSEGILSMETDITAFMHSPEGTVVGNQKEDDTYVQEGSALRHFDNLKDTYKDTKDAANGVQDKVNSQMRALFNEAFGDAIRYSLLESELSESMSGGVLGDIWDGAVDNAYDKMFGDDVNVEYYIDGNIYTVIYHEAKDNSSSTVSSYEESTVKEIKVQIAVEENEISIIREETSAVIRKYENYTVTETTTEDFDAEIKYGDVKVKEPSIDKYSNIGD